MSVRVVARLRPLLETELDKDIIVRADSKGDAKFFNVVKIPNPKNESEEFSFAFNGVYDSKCTQEELFTAEVAPHVKSLFKGLDVTIFAYGVTGTGKTHTMRGGLKLAERGVIPRLLSSVFRRGKKISKDSDGKTVVDVALSYYEIYNDKVFDLLEPPEKRTPSGLPLREKDGKTVVVGLSERACGDLRDFERLYIEANNNRVTAATKLNAHSSRSHAILRVKLTQTTGDAVLESTASAIDLAGSEDNRRTDNGRERLVESAAINKSLFVLSQCIEAISRGDKRVPYRESKMTRILSLGQNNGITTMILNLAPLRSYHLDTLSSLNVSSRAKRIEVREIENEVVFKQPPRAIPSTGSGIGPAALQRQPLRPLSNALNAHNVSAGAALAAAKAAEKAPGPVKAFNVYTDKGVKAVAKPTAILSLPAMLQPREVVLGKRTSDHVEISSRPTKLVRPTQLGLAQPPVHHNTSKQVSISADQIEAMVERKVQEILAARATAQDSAAYDALGPVAAAVQAQQQSQISEEVQRRLDALERKIDAAKSQDSRRSEALRLLFEAKQAKEHGDEAKALRFYELAQPFFPEEKKLLAKIQRLRTKLGASRTTGVEPEKPGIIPTPALLLVKPASRSVKKLATARTFENEDESYHHDAEADIDDESFVHEPARARARKAQSSKVRRAAVEAYDPASPRAQQLLDIVNSRNLAAIRGLQGFGAKKAQDLIDHLALSVAGETGRIESLAQLRLLPGMGGKALDRAYEGLAVGEV